MKTKLIFSSLSFLVLFFYSESSLYACSEEVIAKMILSNISDETINEVCGKTNPVGKKDSTGSAAGEKIDLLGEKEIQAEKKNVEENQPEQQIITQTKTSEKIIENNSSKTEDSNSSKKLPNIKIAASFFYTDILLNEYKSSTDTVNEDIVGSGTYFSVKKNINKSISIGARYGTGTISEITQKSSKSDIDKKYEDKKKDDFKGTFDNFSIMLEKSFFVDNWIFAVGFGYFSSSYTYSFQDKLFSNGTVTKWDLKAVGTYFIFSTDYHFENSNFFLHTFFDFPIQTTISGSRVEKFDEKGYDASGFQFASSLIGLGITFD